MNKKTHIFFGRSCRRAQVARRCRTRRRKASACVNRQYLDISTHNEEKTHIFFRLQSSSRSSRSSRPDATQEGQCMRQSSVSRLIYAGRIKNSHFLAFAVMALKSLVVQGRHAGRPGHALIVSIHVYLRITNKKLTFFGRRSRRRAQVARRGRTRRRRASTSANRQHPGTSTQNE